MEIIAIILAISLGIGGFYSHREKKVEVPASVVDSLDYRPMVWMGEDQDAHVQDFRRIGEVKKPGVMKWTDLPLPLAEPVKSQVAPTTIAEPKKSPKHKAKQPARKAIRWDISSGERVDAPTPFKTGMFTGLSYTTGNSDYRHAVQSWYEIGNVGAPCQCSAEDLELIKAQEEQGRYAVTVDLFCCTYLTK